MLRSFGNPGAAMNVPPPNGVDDTLAFNVALAALPTTKIGATTFHVGTLQLGAAPKGNPYKFGAGGIDTYNVGPFVNVVGLGPNATWLSYYGKADCLRASNTVQAAGDFTSMAAFYGLLDKMTIDGTNAQVGACGLRYGDVEGGKLGDSLFVQNFTGVLAAPVVTLGTTATTGGTFPAGAYSWVVTALCGATSCQESLVSNTVAATLTATGTQVLNWAAVPNATGYRIYRQFSGDTYRVTTVGAGVTSYTDIAATNRFEWVGNHFPQGSSGGSVGLCLDNQVNWTENTVVRVSVFNCQTCFLLNGTGGTTGTDSFEYNDFNFKAYAEAGQSAFVLQNGVRLQNCTSLKFSANMTGSATDVQQAFLVLRGTGVQDARPYGAGQYTVVIDSHLIMVAESYGGNVNPITILFSSTNEHQIVECNGIASWLGNWSHSNGGGANFQMLGQVNGDTALKPVDGFGVTGNSSFAGGSLTSGKVFMAGNIGLPASTTTTLVTTPSLPVGTYLVSGFASLVCATTIAPIDLYIAAGTATLDTAFTGTSTEPSGANIIEEAALTVPLTVTAAGTITLLGRAGVGAVGGAALYATAVSGVATATGITWAKIA